MIIECMIDGKHYNLSVNSDKPLLNILVEDLNNPSMRSICKGARCGNCLVLINGKASLSCLVPAFRLKDANIMTFESFRKTRLFRDIDRAYRETGCMPCPECYASKTLIIESILEQLETTMGNESVFEMAKVTRIVERETKKQEQFANLMRELSINSCPCTRLQDLAKVVEACLEYRSKRNVPRS